jgi:phosphate transport system substrate-binding protein
LISKVGICKTWFVATLLIAAFLAVFVSGCAVQSPTSSDSGLSGTIKIIGSNTVTPISSVWAEEFMKKNTKVRIAVSGPGSGVGIAAFIDGTTDICQSSRTITAEEINKAKANGKVVNEIQVATDALSVVVNPKNPVSELTIAQLSAIYTGKITNWKEIGGDDVPIVAISRDTNSGTHVFFKEHVVQMTTLPTKNTKLEYGDKVLFLPSTEGGITEVAKNPNAVFYAGLGYLTNSVKAIAIKNTPNDKAVLPSVKTSLDGTYPVSRPLLFYTNGAPTGINKTFIDYCLSAGGQKIVTDLGFVPIAK